jgi:mono/diheme cytochrome c family protein
MMTTSSRTTQLALLLITVISAAHTLLPQNPPQQSPNAAPTFYRDVLPILRDHCEVCHRSGGIAPIAFDSYDQARRYAAAIRAFTQSKSMPPWFADPAVGHFANDPSLTAAQIATLTAWVAASTPAGDPHDAPPPHSWAASWSIPRPDLTLTMPRPVPLPASGDVDYTLEIVPTHFTEARWVQAAEVLPSARANVHHAVVFIRPPDSSWLRHAPVGQPFTAATLTDPEDRRGTHWTDNDILLVYAPGSSPGQFPDGMAKLVPAGSDLVFQMHYTTNGTAATDQTAVGLIFAKQPPSQRVLTLQLTNDHFVIPPGAPDFRVEARGTLPNDALLLSFFPHMHLRGKRFEYNIIHRESTSAANRESSSPHDGATCSAGRSPRSPAAFSSDGVTRGSAARSPDQSDTPAAFLGPSFVGRAFKRDVNLHPATGLQPLKTTLPQQTRAPITIEPLLRVNYHFHWQMSYILAEPRLLKAGTELQAVAWFDNSAQNPHNPDPTASVRWGEQTYDEMMVGFFDVAVAPNLDKHAYFRRH